MKTTPAQLCLAYSAKAFLLLALLWSGVVQAQKTALIQVRDRFGNIDTVRIGMAPGATKDVDPALGEADFTGIPWRATEIRSVNTPQMCFVQGQRRQSVYLAQLKLDLRDSVFGMPRLSQLNPSLPLYGWTESQVTNNTFNLQVRCAAPPCTVTMAQNWPYDRFGNDEFYHYTFLFDGSGQLDCGVSVDANVTNSSQNLLSLISQDTSFVVSSSYVVQVGTSLAKSFSDLGMRIEQGYLINTTTRVPREVAVVDAMGRVVHTTPWPAENRMAMPVLPRGIYLYRISYPERVVTVRVLGE